MQEGGEVGGRGALSTPILAELEKGGAGVGGGDGAGQSCCWHDHVLRMLALCHPLS